MKYNDLVELPKGRKVSGSNWVYKTKMKADGSKERYKARLVAQGFMQRQKCQLAMIKCVRHAVVKCEM